VRQAHPVRHRARRAHRASAAAGRLGVVLGVAPQLERDRHRLAALAGDQQRRDRGVHAAAHRHERPPGRERRRAVRPSGGAERAVQRVSREVRGVELARREPAELGGHVVGADPRRREHGRALGERHRGRPGGQRRPAPRGVEARLRDAVALDAQGNPHEIAARGAARRTRVGAGRRVAAPRGRAQVVLEGLGVHDRRV
jgi:hypothetical protein